MSEVLLANLFFIITGSAVLVVGAFMCVLCYHLTKVARHTRSILKKIEASAESLTDEVRVLREHITNGTIFGRIFGTIASAISARKSYRSPRRKRTVTQEDT